MANEVMINNSNIASNEWEDIDSVSNADGDFSLGWFWKSSDSSTRKAIGFLRFPSVSITPGTIDYAGVYIWTKFHAEDFDYFNNMPSPSGTWDFTIRGIDEDNTASFTSNPYPRAQTTAYNTSSNGDEPGKNTYKEVTVTSAVQEVMQRGGWSSGNAIGLVFEPINSGVGKFITDGGDMKAFMVIRKSAEPNFTPTNKTVSAPTFPSAKSVGYKSTYPGTNVLTNTNEDKFYFKSSKKIHKIALEGSINTTAGVAYPIAHGQTNIPFAEAFAKSNTTSQRFRLPRFLPSAVQSGPSSDTLNGYIEIDSTYLWVVTSQNAQVYYRIFIDEITS